MDRSIIGTAQSVQADLCSIAKHTFNFISVLTSQLSQAELSDQAAKSFSKGVSIEQLFGGAMNKVGHKQDIWPQIPAPCSGNEY